MLKFNPAWKNILKRIFVNGTFDILHQGHLKLLNYARGLGDFLVVAIDSDHRVSLKKGIDRPVMDQLTRAEILKNLRCVDEVVIFGSDENLRDIICQYTPEIMVVGSDWKGKPIVGSEYAKELIFFERNDDNSTTKTLERYLNRR